ncbi:MAG: hypothetical protein JNJ85_09575 [Candidatus Kapabacteria bacterium]|nr:hypothetical protein [Candidatus Kapabacteria bacterium]
MKYFAILLLAVLFISCADKATNNDTNVTPTKHIIPLRVGNTWYYKSNNSLTNFKDSVQVFVSEKTTVGNIDWYKFAKTSGFSSGMLESFLGVMIGDIDHPELHYVSNKQDGYYHVYAEDASKLITSTGAIFWKYPVSNNHNYNTVFHAKSSAILLNIKVDSLNSTITTSAGSFECIIYTFDTYSSSGQVSAKYKYYISPSVGVIKCEITNSKYTETIELYRYILG